MELPNDIDSADYSVPKLDEGIYRVAVENTEIKTSEKGNETVKLTLKIVSTKDGASTPTLTLFDQLVFLPDNKMCMAKIQAFRKAFGVSGRGIADHAAVIGKTMLASLKYKPSRKDPAKSYLEVDKYLSA